MYFFFKDWKNQATKFDKPVFVTSKMVKQDVDHIPTCMFDNEANLLCTPHKSTRPTKYQKSPTEATSKWPARRVWV